MLPIYKAISFQRVLEKGGRTKPWLILVNTGVAIQPFVVKLFETSLIEEKDSVANEVIGNILANEFHLPVPHAALIDIGTDFVKTIKDPSLLEVLKNKDGRLKFGSMLLDGFVRFDSSAVSLTEAKKMIEIDSVFAFDNLIRNPDRNNIKPNVLVRSNNAFLIDHELGFEITTSCTEELNNWNWKERFFRYHIFYDYLKGTQITQKRDYFNEFEEYLKLLNINILEPYFDQLTSCGFSGMKHNTIINYLLEMKRKSSIFVNMLRGVIS